MAPRDAPAKSDPRAKEPDRSSSSGERRRPRREQKGDLPERLPPAAERAQKRKQAGGPATVRVRLSDPPRPAGPVSPDADTRQAEERKKAQLKLDKKLDKKLKKAKQREVADAPKGASAGAGPTSAPRDRLVADPLRGFHKTSRVELRAVPRVERWQRTLAADLVGLGLVALGLLVGLALFSYSPEDPGITAQGSRPVGNWIGPAGALLADGLTLLLGLAAFATPALLGLAGLAFLRARVKVPRARQLFGMAVAAGGAVILLDVALGRHDALPFPAGGLAGVILGSLLVPVLFPLGTGIVATVLGVAGGVIMLDRSIGHALDETFLAITRLRKQAIERYGVWKETRRLLLEERERLEAELLELEAEEAFDAEQSGILRRARIADAAQARAKERLEAEKGSEAVSLSSLPRIEVDAEPAAPDSAPPVIAQVRSDVSGLVEEPAPTPALGRPVSEEILIVNDERVADPALGHDPRWVGDQALPDVMLDKSVRLLGPVPNVPTTVERTAPRSPRPPKKRPPPSPSSTSTPGAPSADAAPPDAREPAEEGDAGLCIRERGDAEVNLDEDDPTVPDLVEKRYELPPLRLLDYDAPERIPLDEQKMLAEADKLVRKFQDFGIDGRVREVRPGPVVTTYEFVPAPGIKVSRIAALSDDIAMAMEAVHVRIVAPIPGKGAVGIEIPNERRETVFLKEIIASERFKRDSDRRDDKLIMALGKDIEGKPYTADLAAMPHVLISGTTGSGKSVSVNAMICSLLYRATPDDVRFLMIDPKMLELSVYEGIPHLLLPPIIDSKKAANALQWAVGEMERRYLVMSELGVRDLAGYNDAIDAIKAGTDKSRKLPTDGKGTPAGRLPYIVIVIDEYADLLAIAGKEVEVYVMRLAQKARAAGLHVMLATQRPSVDVITGVIKANFPVRMGFRLASNHDSKTIINRPGAEKLLGRGDMLIMPAGTSNVTRVHGAYISEKELHRVVEFLKAQGEPDYDMSIVATPAGEDGASGDLGDEEKDPKWDEAIAVVARSRRCSTSWLQRQLGIGYNRAARIVEMMEREGLVGPQLNSKGDRDILLAPV